MPYVVEICEAQEAGPPKVLRSNFERFSYDDVVILARARLDAAPLPDGTIVGARNAAKVFIRVLEVDSNGRRTDQVVFEYKITDQD